MAKRTTRPDPAGGKDDPAVQRLRKSLGRVLAELRDGLGMSQAEFAVRLELDQTTIAKQETGVHLMRMDAWLKVAQVVNVPFYELFRKAWERDGQLTRGGMRRVEALDDDEVELVRIWRQLTKEGRDTLMGRAGACLELYHREDNVVPLVHGKHRASHKKSSA